MNLSPAGTDFPEISRALLQNGLWLLAATVPLLLTALCAARLLRGGRRDDPVAACAVLRLALVGTALLAVALPLLPLLQAARPVPAPVPQSPPVREAANRAERPVALNRVLAAPLPPRPPPLILPGNDPGPVYAATAVVWAAGALVLLTGLGFSHAYLRRLRREGSPVPADSPATLALAALGSGAGCPAPLLLTHPRALVPFAALFPGAPSAIFLPPDYETAFPADALPAVLAHEWAHLRRRDAAWGLAARLICALLWPQPLLWMLLRETEAAQEMACDREALRLTAPVTGAPPTVAAAALARSLVAFADRYRTLGESERRAARISGTAVLSRPSLLEERIRSLMHTDVPFRPPTLSPRTRAALASGTLLTVSLALTATRLFARTAPALPAPASYAAADAALAEPALLQESDPLQQRVTVEFRALPLEEALRRALADTDLTLTWDDSLPPEVRSATVSLAVGNTTRGYLISSICRSSSSRMPVGWRREGSTVRVGKRGVNGLTTAYVDLGPDGLPVGRVTAVFAEPASLDSVLSRIFTRTGIEPQIYDADGRAVTGPNITTRVRAENLTYKDALEAALRHASVPLTYTVGPAEGVAIRATAPIPPHPFLQGDAQGTGLPKTPVTLEANDMPLRVALAQVLDQAKQSYSVDNRVVGTVTGTYKAVPLNELLPRLLALSATPLEYIVQNGAVYVRSTAAAPTAPAGAPQPPAPAPASPQPAAPPPAASPAPATPAPQSQRSPALDDLVSADFRALHIEEAFRQALAGSGLTLGWDQGVNPAAYKETIVTLKATSVDRESLLNLICRSQGMKAPPDRIASPLSLPSRLFWRLDGNTVRLITERPSAGIGYSQRGADALPEGRVTLHFPEPTPLTTVLKELFRGTGIGIQIAVEGAPAITTSVTAENATFEEALSAILRNASRRLVYRLPSQGLIQFQDAPSTRPPVAVSYAPKPDPIPGDAQGTGLPKTRVTLIAENMSLRDALFKVFAAVRQDFTVDNAVTGTVTGEFKDVPLNELVPRLLAQAALPTEYYVAGNNVVIIRPARQR